jgi:ketosteroid isomerase-like protein
MNPKDNAEVMLEIFAAIERRDPQRMLELCHPDVEFHWPASLPYGGTSRGLAGERHLDRHLASSAAHRG